MEIGDDTLVKNDFGKIGVLKPAELCFPRGELMGLVKQRCQGSQRVRSGQAYNGQPPRPRGGGYSYDGIAVGGPQKSSSLSF